MVSEETKIIALFAVGATALWYLTLGDITARMSWAILLGLGVVVPTAVNELRG